MKEYCNSSVVSWSHHAKGSQVEETYTTIHTVELHFSFQALKVTDKKVSSFTVNFIFFDEKVFTAKSTKQSSSDTVKCDNAAGRLL